jgi:hypothetical protein
MPLFASLFKIYPPSPHFRPFHCSDQVPCNARGSRRCPSIEFSIERAHWPHLDPTTQPMTAGSFAQMKHMHNLGVDRPRPTSLLRIDHGGWDQLSNHLSNAVHFDRIIRFQHGCRGLVHIQDRTGKLLPSTTRHLWGAMMVCWWTSSKLRPAGGKSAKRWRPSFPGYSLCGRPLSGLGRRLVPAVPLAIGLGSAGSGPTLCRLLHGHTLRL